MSATLPPECRIDLSLHTPDGVMWGATTVGRLSGHPQAEAVFAGTFPPQGDSELLKRLTGKRGCQFGVKRASAGVPALSAENIRAEMTRAASRLPADIGWADVRKVTVWEMPVIDEHYWFWLEPLP